MKRNTRPPDSICWDCKNARAPFNRTTVECKDAEYEKLVSTYGAFNRTTVECKVKKIFEGVVRVSGL